MTSDTTTTTTVLKERIGSVDSPLGNYTTNILLLREKTVLKLQDDSICVEESMMTSGTTKEGKRWYKWKTTKRMTVVFRSRQKGPRRVYAYEYSSERKRRYNRATGYETKVLTSLRDKTPDSDFWRVFFAHSEVIFSEFSARVEKYFPYVYKRVLDRPITIFGEAEDTVAFALMSAYPASIDAMYPRRLLDGSRGSVLLTSLREETMTLSVKKLFGKKYRKSLTLSVSNAHDSTILFARDCKNIVPIDWIVDGLRTCTDVGYYPKLEGKTSLYGEDHIFNTILLRVSSGRRRDFFVSCFGSEVVDDVCRMYGWNDDLHTEYDVLIRNSRDIETLHDEMLQLRNRRRQRIDQDKAAAPIPLTEISSTYNDIVIENRLKIVTPEAGQTLYDWSAMMGNCISGYINPAIQGTVNLGGVYEGDKLIANFEIDNKKNLKQLLGKRNQALTEDKRNAIIDALASVEAIHIDTVTQAWGVPTYTPIEQRMIEA